MLLTLGGIALAFVLVNGIMLWVSLQGPPLLVTTGYYEQARRYDKDRAQRAAGAQAGWQIQAAPAAGDAATVDVRIAAGAGHPVAGLAGIATAYRPSDGRLDQALSWSADAATPGLYHARFARPAPGLWQVTLLLARGTERLDHTFRYVAP
jgi:nitrogen fixation protein FixH